MNDNSNKTSFYLFTRRGGGRRSIDDTFHYVSYWVENRVSIFFTNPFSIKRT